MLEYIGQGSAAKAIVDATTQIIAEGKRVTYDLGGTTGTMGMAQAIADLI